MTKDELANIEKKALDQLLSGKSLFGKEGAFAPLMKRFLALQHYSGTYIVLFLSVNSFAYYIILLLLYLNHSYQYFKFMA